MFGKYLTEVSWHKMNLNEFLTKNTEIEGQEGDF